MSDSLIVLLIAFVYAGGVAFAYCVFASGDRPTPSPPSPTGTDARSPVQPIAGPPTQAFGRPREGGSRTRLTSSKERLGTSHPEAP